MAEKLDQTDSLPSNDDQTDAKIFKFSFGSSGKSEVDKHSNGEPKPITQIIRDPSYLFSEYYDLNGKRIAKIFSHYKFYTSLRYKDRVGNEKDEIYLQETLQSKGFEVELCKDYPYHKIMNTLREIEDDKSISCVIVVVMTHGEPNKVCAVDMMYNVSELWEIFLGKLLTVPKLFFIQACRGQKTDCGATIKWEADGPLNKKDPDLNYTLPLMADFLMMYSTYEGHKSFRSCDGTWFIRSLTDVLNDENYEHKDLLQLLTIVNNKVALDFISKCKEKENDHKKQMPQIVSMLTKLLKFK